MKKKITIAIISLFAIFVLAVMFRLFVAPVVDAAVPLPEFSEKIPVYRVIKPDITAEYVAALGSKFGMTDEVNGTAGAGFGIKNKETGAVLSVYANTGTISWGIDSRLYPKEKPSLPSNEEAMKIATDFLVERGLLPEGRVASSVNRGGTSSYGTAHLLVGFTSSVRVTGPGANFGVRIGDGGEVVQVFINPINPQELPVDHMATLKPVAQAYREMKKERRKHTPVGTIWVSVNSVHIAYWLNPIDQEQGLIYPVYVFQGKRGDTLPFFDSQKDGFIGLIEATSESSIYIPAVS